MFIYIGGAILAVIVLLSKLPNGWESVVAAAAPAHKFQVFSLGFDKSLAEYFRINYTLFSGILGGAFLSMASHGTDQLIVQRLLACKNLRSSQKALITSGIIVMAQFALFLTLGLMLFTYYGGAAMRSDEVLPRFIVEGLPAGVSGFIIAGIFAAAMSTLSGSLNSIASSTMLDLYKPRWGKQNSARKDLLLSRLLTFFWGIVFIGVALLFQDEKNPVVELGLAIASFTYGGLLGSFLLGNLNHLVEEDDALVAMWGAIFFMTWVIGQSGVVLATIILLNLLAGLWVLIKVKHLLHRWTIILWTICTLLLIISTPPLRIAWPWYVLIGCAITISLGSLLALRKKTENR